MKHDGLLGATSAGTATPTPSRQLGRRAPGRWFVAAGLAAAAGLLTALAMPAGR